MAKIQWQDGLCVGIDRIDNQHRQWLKHYNDTVDILASRHNGAQIMKTIGFLIDYTETHFSTEEGYMDESRYPALPEHKAKHDELRATLSGLVKDFEEEGVTPELTKAVDAFLGNWLVRHIQEEDMKFGAFVRREGIALP